MTTSVYTISAHVVRIIYTEIGDTELGMAESSSEWKPSHAPRCRSLLREALPPNRVIPYHQARKERILVYNSDIQWCEPPSPNILALETKI